MRACLADSRLRFTKLDAVAEQEVEWEHETSTTCTLQKQDRGYYATIHNKKLHLHQNAYAR